MVAVNPYTLVTFRDFKFWIRINPGYQDIKTINEVLYADPYDIKSLKTMIDPDVVFDIGGHVGSFGVLARSTWPSCRLIAFEPMKDSHDLYIRNLKENGLWDINKCMVYNRPVSYLKEKVVMIHASRTTGGNVLLPETRAIKYINIGYRYYNRLEKETDVNIEPITMEEVFHQLDIPRVDLAKWDCEGSEVGAFENMEPWAASRFRYMTGEYHLGKADYLKYLPREREEFWRTARRNFPHLFWLYEGSSGSCGIFKTFPKD